jgi:hypothetical protein
MIVAVVDYEAQPIAPFVKNIAPDVHLARRLRYPQIGYLNHQKA